MAAVFWFLLIFIGQPNNYHDDEDCGTIRWHNSLYKWNDAPCYKDNFYICET